MKNKTIPYWAKALDDYELNNGVSTWTAEKIYEASILDDGKISIADDQGGTTFYVGVGAIEIKKLFEFTQKQDG